MKLSLNICAEIRVWSSLRYLCMRLMSWNLNAARGDARGWHAALLAGLQAARDLRSCQSHERGRACTRGDAGKRSHAAGRADNQPASTPVRPAMRGARHARSRGLGPLQTGRHFAAQSAPSRFFPAYPTVVVHRSAFVSAPAPALADEALKNGGRWRRGFRGSETSRHRSGRYAGHRRTLPRDARDASGCLITPPEAA